MARLHSRIYLHFLGVLLVVGATTALVFALSTREHVRHEMAEAMARHLASLAAERLDDPAGLRTRLGEIHEHLHVDLAVYDAAGRLIAAAGRPLPPVGREERQAARQDRVIVRPRPPGFAAAPVHDPRSGAVVGMLQTAAPRPFGSPPLWRPALIAGVALLVVAIATRPLAQRISRPLEQLTQAARRLGAGDLGARAEPTTRHGPRADEIAELTRAFNEMAERVQRLVRGEKELLANISHELRSPLSRIRVALELLPRDGDSDRRLRDVERDLAELDRLIEDVLTTARLEATGLPANLATVDARRLLEALAARAKEDPLTASTAVEVEDGGPLTLLADEALLRRALWNLIENAAKYGAPPVTLGAARDGDDVCLSVTDRGAGIAAGDRERVFAPFYRGDAARTPGAAGDTRGGVGLGLTLARRVAEVHGGAITISPGPTVNGREQGCRVTITLPQVTARS